MALIEKARKPGLTARLADAIHSIETVPLPGTRLYSFLTAKQIRPLYAAIAEQIVRDEHFSRILDVGSGPGYVAVEIALRNPDASVFGIDTSSYMVDIARANAQLAKATKSVQFQTGDPQTLPFPGRYFDLALSANVLHHWKQPLAVFESVYHVLANGGEFWVYDYRSDTAAEIWEEIGRGLSFSMRTALQFGPMASSRSAYGPQQLLELARQTHFECLGVENITLPLFGRQAAAFNRLRLRRP